MPTYDTSTGLRVLQGANVINNIDEGLLALAQDVQAAIAAAAAALVPAGTLAPTARLTEPAGWLFCDGRAVSRTTYATLFAAIGTTYGVGDGTTTFNLPDARGRALVMADGTAGRLTANDAMGQSGGEERHTLAFSEIPAGAARNWQDSPGQYLIQPDGSGLGFNQSLAQPGGLPHNNMQPYLIVNQMIKA